MKPLMDKIRRTAVRALSDYSMIENDDRVLVAVSGGKDSAIMLLLLEEIRKKAPFNFTLYPLIVNQHNPGFDSQKICAWMGKMGFNLAIHDEDTYSIVRNKIGQEETPCGLCARLRRGILYNYAYQNGYNKIALGHHRDDLNETLLLNIFYGGRIASMPPKLKSDDGRNIVIRPLCYVAEKDIQEASRALEIPTATCTDCIRGLDLKRVEVKNLIRTLEVTNPALRASLMTAQQNIRPSQLADREHWPFAKL